MNIVIIGSAYPLRGGGIATFNERLAREFAKQGHDTTIYTFSLQYPSFLFPGTTQYSTEPAPQDLNIKVCINSVNPFNWLKVGRELKNLKPDIIVVRYWIPFMGAALGRILRSVKKNNHTKIICIADNVLPHEKRIGDEQLTKYFVKPIDAFVTMSKKVLSDLKQFTNKKAQLVVHPLYDNFGEAISKQEARKYLNINDEPTILFFGFIRAYKGLDILLKAMKILVDESKTKSIVLPKLLITGEFYEDKEKYFSLIKELGIESLLILKTDFIPDSEVRYCLSAADFVIQPYRSATQSGVTPLAYHFEKPMLVTNVGGLPDMVENEKTGVVVDPDEVHVAQGIERLYDLGEAHFIPFIREEKKKYSWQVLVSTILETG
ncbi:glycosyl transferase family 1 [Arachidicoccus ginsenosidimutans]|uniref:glycosyltransferase family 4 protein n=1 Tax=Arachidicoccus sp. BS20 TaxID=1850526 RepID=UPI0007F09CE9|nr:glycosyltransferase family 4 protein [Arachidicoccus sp. BS20]ANI90024.1 glycosyl transferase family 1 [Arachidicoccus sp. BS20]